MIEQLETVWSIVQVALGIGLIIFVHEFGHFLAARWCKVRVEVFSLGFGPQLFSWTRGDTTYQIAAVPLGGYVRMGGEEWSAEPREQRDDDLQSKTVGQRFLIFSGGVIANVIFGLIVFPILFAVGVPFNEPVVAETIPGGPAWQAGIERGTRILKANGKEVLDYSDVSAEVALGPSDECLLEVLAPGAETPSVVRVEPVYNETYGYYTIGLGRTPIELDRIEVRSGGPAAAAGLRSGDRIVSVEGALPGRSLMSQIDDHLRRLEPLSAVVERDGQTFPVVIEPEAERDGARILGVVTPSNHLTAIRGGARTAALPLQVDDRLLSIDGRPIYRADDLLRGLLAAEGAPQLVVSRLGQKLELELPALMDQAAALALFYDLALSVDMDSTVLTLSQNEAAFQAGVRDGDVVLTIDGSDVSGFEQIRERIEAAVAADRGVLLSLARPGAGGDGPEFLSLEVMPQERLRPTYGFALQLSTYVYRASGPIEALRVGVASCWKFIEQAILTVKGIVRADVSGKNMGGIITIGVVAHSFALAGWSKFFFFLCILSMNLAFLNVLPIPLLDGGHLMFLLIEKVKGSPVSERVMSYSQLVGLVFIITLFVYVIYNDVQRVFVQS